MAAEAAELSSIVDVASHAARAAGALILRHAGRVAIAGTKADEADLVTAIDRECQAVIKSAVAAAFPAHAFLGEEDVAPGSAAAAAALDAAISSAPFLWVVDPIDGTTNFVCGIPLSCVSIGVALRGVVVAAVLYEPSRDELFTATRGGGAFINGARCAVGAEETLSRAVLGFGLHHMPHVARAMVTAASAVSPHCRGLRALGSAALMLAYVACGRLGGFFELSLCPWDLAAGSLLVTEAGGCVTDMSGAPYSLHTAHVFASNGAPGVHAPLVKLLVDAKVDTC